MTVAITRQELGASELRREAVRCRDAEAARRMLALALVLEGHSREEAARHAGMDRQTLRDWVHRYNAEGSPACTTGPIAGRSRGSRPSRWRSWRRSSSKDRTRRRDGVVRWRRVDLQALIKAPLRRRAARALGRQGAAPARLRPPVGAPQAPVERSRGAGSVQKDFARAGAGGAARARGRQADRDLVPG